MRAKRMGTGRPAVVNGVSLLLPRHTGEGREGESHTDDLGAFQI
jgi:hypothetical protein